MLHKKTLLVAGFVMNDVGDYSVGVWLFSVFLG